MKTIADRAVAIALTLAAMFLLVLHLGDLL
jgi:hypothetical protein